MCRRSRRMSTMTNRNWRNTQLCGTRHAVGKRETPESRVQSTSIGRKFSLYSIEYIDNKSRMRCGAHASFLHGAVTDDRPRARCERGKGSHQSLWRKIGSITAFSGPPESEEYKLGAFRSASSLKLGPPNRRASFREGCNAPLLTAAGTAGRHRRRNRTGTPPQSHAHRPASSRRVLRRPTPA
jgi:hypothetical protein